MTAPSPGLHRLALKGVGGGLASRLGSLRSFIRANGSKVASAHPDTPTFVLGTTSASLGGSVVARTGSRLRYIGGHTIENYALTQPGTTPQDVFSSAKNLSYNATDRTGQATVVEFDITCPQFELLEYGGNAQGCRVVVDGMIAGTYTTAADGAKKYRLFDFSAINPAAVQRRIRLEYPLRSLIGGLVLDTVGTLLALQTTPAKRIVFLGDSFVEGTSGTTGTTLHDALAPYAAKLLGFDDYWISGFGGTGYLSDNTGVSPARPNLADRIAYDVAGTADLYVVAMGVNDAALYNADAVTNGPLIAANIAAVLNAIRTAHPTALILVVGVWGDGSGGLSASKTAVNNLISAACAGRPGVRFWNAYPTSFTIGATPHPDASGHITLGTALAADVRSWCGA